MSAGVRAPSNAEIRDYLLRRLSDTGRARFEEAYFADDALLDRIESEEDHLVSDYVLGRLAESDRLQFEKSLLGAPYYKKKVETTSRLNLRIRRPGLFERPRRGDFPDPKGGSPRARGGRRQSVSALFPQRGAPAIAIGLLAVLLLAALASALQLKRQLSSLRRAAATEAPAAPPSPAAPTVVLSDAGGVLGPGFRRLRRPAGASLVLVLPRSAVGADGVSVTLLDDRGRLAWGSGPRRVDSADDADLAIRVPPGVPASTRAAIVLGGPSDGGNPGRTVLVLQTDSR